MHSARTQRVLVPTGLAGMSGLVSSLHHCHRYTVTAARETVGAKDSFGAKTWSPKQGKQTHVTMRKSQQKPKNSNINNRSALISHSSHNVKLIASRTHPHSSPCIFHHSNYQTSYRMHPHSPLLAHRQGSRAIPHESALIRTQGPFEANRDHFQSKTLISAHAWSNAVTCDRLAASESLEALTQFPFCLFQEVAAEFYPALISTSRRRTSERP